MQDVEAKASEVVSSTPVASRADSEPRPPIGRSDAVLLGAAVAIAPGIGYMVSWFHEVGYNDTFGVPADLIAPQLSDIFIATGGLALLTFVIYFLLHLYVGLRAPGKTLGTIEFRIALLSATALILVLLEYLLRSLPLRIVVLGTWVLSGLIYFVPITRSKGTYRERLEAQLRAIGRRSLSSVVFDRIGFRYAIIALAGLGAIELSLLFGVLEADQQTHYLVTTSGPPELVVRIYGDTVILADYDAAAHQVRHRYHVQKLGNQPLNLEDRHLGHMSLADS
jgi:hypothetical protein